MEPWRNPHKSELVKMQEAIKDPVIGGILQLTIREIFKNNPELNWHPKSIAGLKNDLVLAVRDFGFAQIFNWLQEAGYKNAIGVEERLRINIYLPNKKEKKTSTLTFEGKTKITDIALAYGLEKGKGNNWICPFHESQGKNSLSLSDEKNLFNCFGCSESGDIITFIQKLEDLKNE